MRGPSKYLQCTVKVGLSWFHKNCLLWAWLNCCCNEQIVWTLISGVCATKSHNNLAEKNYSTLGRHVWEINKTIGKNKVQYAPTSYLTLLYIEMWYSKGRLYCKYSAACWSLCPFTGYTSGFCEQILSDPCASNPCFNNGTCMYNSSSGNYRCHCTQGLYANFAFVNYFDANNESIDSNGICAKWPTSSEISMQIVLWQGE